MTVPRLKVGERPDPFIHTFEDLDGEPISVSDPTFSIRYPDGTAETFDADIVSGPAGEVSYQVDEITQAGTHRYEFFADSGGERFASPTLFFYADAAIEATSGS